MLDQWQRMEDLGIDPCGSLHSVFKNPDFGTHNDTQWEGIDCRYQDWVPLEIPRRVTNLHLPEVRSLRELVSGSG